MFSTFLDWTLNSVGKNQVDSSTCFQYESDQHNIVVNFEFKVATFSANWSNYFSLSIFLSMVIEWNCCIHLTNREFQEYAKRKRNKSRYGVLPYQNNLVCVELLLELNKLQRTWTMVTPLTCMLNCLCREKHKDLWLVWNHYQVCYHHL